LRNENLEQLVAARTQRIVAQSQELTHRSQQLVAAQSATIAAFCSLAEVRDNETGNHILRTQNYARALAEKLQQHPRFEQELTDENIYLIYKSAPLHDIGKVAIPDSILLKPDKLTPAEWDIMRRHCEYGLNAISRAEQDLGGEEDSFLHYAREVAYTHHERWDGAGYPTGLRGDEIPVSGRLMAVADVYDALISKRVYKPAFPHEQAVEIIVKSSASHFDPDIVQAMLEVENDFKVIARRYRDEE
jgi:putative two-component system response regulator